MKLRRNKKGFTIVELIIVIAVIGVLTAILVPTFISLTAKANKASDQSLVKNLNIALASREGEADDKPNKTMHDAVEDLELWGYKLGALATKSDEKLIYNLEDNRFYLDGDEKLDEVQNKMNLWRIQDNLGDQEYSIYASDNFDLAEVTGLHVGFDVGYHTNIQSIEYSNTSATSDVIIRTDSFASEVSVNTAGSVVHYGNVGKLDIQKVAMSSFHENGKARAVKLAEGNFVIEPEGSVTLVSVVATEADKVTLDIQGELEVLAGDDDLYEVTSGSADETIDAAIDEGTIAIVNGVAKTALTASDFANGSKVVLLQDYDTQVALGSCTVVGNMTKLNALISGSANIVLQNIHTNNIHGASVSGKSYLYDGINFSGSLTLDGGLLEYDGTATSNAEEAAIYINNGYGTYTFKNMVVAANTNKGIKISKAASVTVENCEFDASRLVGVAANDPSGSHARSLSAIDIQEQNVSEKMSVAIRNCVFKDIPQGQVKGGTADADTSAAIKLKAEVQGFSSVVVTGNTFKGNYRDLGVGVALRYYSHNNTFLDKKTPADMRRNVIDGNWTIANNTTTLTESVIASRGYLTYEVYNNSTFVSAQSERVGRLLGGCGVWETARSTHANDDQ